MRHKHTHQWPAVRLVRHWRHTISFTNILYEPCRLQGSYSMFDRPQGSSELPPTLQPVGSRAPPSVVYENCVSFVAVLRSLSTRNAFHTVFDKKRYTVFYIHFCNIPCSFVCWTFIFIWTLPRSKVPSVMTRTHGMFQGRWLSFPIPPPLHAAAMSRTGLLFTSAWFISSRQRVEGTGSGLPSRTDSLCAGTIWGSLSRGVAAHRARTQDLS